MEEVMLVKNRQMSIRVDDASQVSAARRAVSDLAFRLGFDETHVGKAALITTEAATNLLKHAAGGEILVRELPVGEGDTAAGIEIVAIDSGPGIGSLPHSMVDGTSTSGTSGTGLGAMHRIAHYFEVHTHPGKGTVICMRLWGEEPTSRTPLRTEVGAVCIPLPGEVECGDAWECIDDDADKVVMVADGLGHGPEAALASGTAVSVPGRFPGSSCARLMDIAHGELRATRGAAIAVTRITGNTLTFAGVGNIAACVFQGCSRKQLVSHNGIVGNNLRKVQEFSVPLEGGDLLVMNSDGLASNWSLDAYPGILSSDPAIIAAVLYRDFWRRRDDVTVLVIRFA
jgi:anti-sigma regulatory factor (Ser/Thr protein kinase)